MTRAIVAAAAAVVVAGMGSGPAWADDLNPASWRDTNHPGYTIQEWEFAQPGTPLPPDGSIPTINPGNPMLLFTIGTTWTPNFQNTGLDGYFASSASAGMGFGVPNILDNEPMKLLRIQINGIWDTGFAPFVSSLTATKGGDSALVEFIGSDEPFPGFHRYEDWAIFPNPDDEIVQLFLPGGAFVNQVVIETISFPEPASLALLGLGGLAVCRRRRG